MAAALFTILKVLGLIVLAILAIVLVLVLLVLFVPIRYLYRFRYNDEVGDCNCHYVDVNWILRIIQLRINIALSGISFKVRIFGIRCRFIENILQNKTKKDTYEEYEYDDESCDNDLDEDECINISDLFEENENLGNLIETYDEEESFYKSDVLEDTNIKIKKSKRIIFKESIKKILDVLNPKKWLKILANKLKKLACSIKDIFVKLFSVINELFESARSVLAKISLITDFLDRPSTVRGLEKVKEYIAVTCKHILPKQKKVVINIGFDNPADTGGVLAAAGVIYPIVGEFIDIYPNFEDKELKLDGYLKGRIRGINVVIIVIKVIRDKAIKRLIYNLNKLKEEL